MGPLSRAPEAARLVKALAATRGDDERVAGGLLLRCEPLNEQQSGASAGHWAQELQSARTRVGAALEDACRATGCRDGFHASVRVVGDEQRIEVGVGTHVADSDSVFSGEPQLVEFVAARLSELQRPLSCAQRRRTNECTV